MEDLRNKDRIPGNCVASSDKPTYGLNRNLTLTLGRRLCQARGGPYTGRAPATLRRVTHRPTSGAAASAGGVYRGPRYSVYTAYVRPAGGLQHSTHQVGYQRL
ncbi:hypothetical protein RRG08_050121 [Elysia crispata]|uniref:Uncharacterized protein n=1 Tax=Elysia crispata TaxID=231223 RepID=A0AAE0Z5Z4_9GAST|nr:hypothetical protein RRG08_050121 [Elysia crispata]